MTFNHEIGAQSQENSWLGFPVWMWGIGTSMPWFFVAWLHHLASWTFVNIYSGNGLLPIKCRAISLSNPDLFATMPLKNEQSFLNRNSIFVIEENTLQKVYKTVDILFRLKCDKSIKPCCPIWVHAILQVTAWNFVQPELFDRSTYKIY